MEAWFSNGLAQWYSQNKRNLPWRDETDAYKIWLSEIILQQTQVVQGLNYYLKFVNHYPNVFELANASEDAVLKDWQGLGYYSRARNLHEAAKFIVANFNGIFPQNYKDIRNLKGVGDYTAAAIASFAYNLCYAVVDGNVYRLLSRVFGIETPIDSTIGKKQFKQLADDMLNSKNPATHNQAVMEFGSQYCRPTNPNCPDCIFNTKCFAFKTGKVNVLPVKLKKTAIRVRYFNYLVLIDKNKNILLNKRSEKDIWQGLYEFKLIESEAELMEQQLCKHDSFQKIVSGKKFDVLLKSEPYKHVLTHQHLFTTFYIINIQKKFDLSNNLANINNFSQFAFPRLIDKFINDINLVQFL
jgi:A/G-specific adenine glycosylase